MTTPSRSVTRGPTILRHLRRDRVDVRAAVMLTAIAMAAPAASQSAPPRPLADDPATLEQRRWRETRDRLELRDADGFLAPVGQRLTLLVEYLDPLDPLPADRREFGLQERIRCEAWSRLAALHLARREGVGARHAFGEILKLAGPGQLDLRGRARFGIAQAHEADGDLQAARELYEEIEAAPEFTGTRYSDWARTASARTDPDSPIGSVGELAPDFGPRRDLTDQVHTLTQHRGKTVLLLFASAEDRRGLQRIDEVLEAARAAGLATNRMPLLLIDAQDKDRIAGLASSSSWRQPILPSRTAFLDRTLLDYRIATLPAWVLIGPDGRLLGRDIPPHRLGLLISKLARR